MRYKKPFAIVIRPQGMEGFNDRSVRDNRWGGLLPDRLLWSDVGTSRFRA